MLIAITGTPGVGKSTVSKFLARKYRVINLHSYAEKHGLLDDYDEETESYNVDVDKLNDAITHEPTEDFVFLDGHLSHFLDCNVIIVLRCKPKILSERLRKRGYNEKKILENIQAEVLDVILQESVNFNTTVYELDCTEKDPWMITNIIERIVIFGEKNDVTPGKINWSEEMEEWF